MTAAPVMVIVVVIVVGSSCYNQSAFALRLSCRKNYFFYTVGNLEVSNVKKRKGIMTV